MGEPLDPIYVHNVVELFRGGIVFTGSDRPGGTLVFYARPMRRAWPLLWKEPS